MTVTVFAAHASTFEMEGNNYTVYNVADVYTRHDENIQEKLDKVVNENQNTTALPGIQGVASGSAPDSSEIADISSDEDLQKLANWFNSRASGPCSGLGQYLVAKAKELNVSPFYAVIIPGIESTYGKNCVTPNNFAGINPPGGFADFESPQACADAMLNSVAGYRDKASFGNVDISVVSNVAKFYCTPPGPWVTQFGILSQEATAATGVAADVSVS